MLQLVLGVVGGFVAWVVLWFGGEKILSAIGPEWFGAHQRAFEAALTNGGEFTANSTLLVTHIFLGSIVSLAAGFLAALIAAGNQRAPLILGIVLLIFGVMKAVMSWRYVPLWYHVLFTALLIPLTILGGRLKAVN